MKCDKKGSVYLSVLIILSLVVSLGMIFINYIKSEIHMGEQGRNLLISRYVAEDGINRMMLKISELADSPLIFKDKKINMKKLDLLSRQRVRSFNLAYEGSEFIKDGRVKVTATIQNVRETPFDCGLLTEDELPLELQAYKINPDTKTSDEKLGGWEGELRIVSQGEYARMTYRIEVVKGIKIMDLSPCAPAHTLFIQGKKEEFLKCGKMVLSNWKFSGDQYKKFSEILDKLLKQAKDIVGMTGGLDLLGMVQVIKNFVVGNDDKEQRAAAEQYMMQLPRWGFVRTNGKMNVYIPFFEVDDIINYFVLNPYFQRPEVGYPGCYNRLHDLYMGKYTKYEGDILKNYYRLAPYILTKQYPREISDKYSRYSTFTYYPSQNAQEFNAENYKRYLESGRRFCCQEFEKNQSLFGTKEEPILLNGLMFISGNLELEGVYKGKGTIMVKDGTVKLGGDVKKFDDSSWLTLIVADQSINMDRNTAALFEGSIYAKQSIQGGKKITVEGNLVVDDLNRQEGAAATQPQMPEETYINYNPEIRNEMADNLVITISSSDLIRRRN